MFCGTINSEKHTDVTEHYIESLKPKGILVISKGEPYLIKIMHVRRLLNYLQKTQYQNELFELLVFDW